MLPGANGGQTDLDAQVEALLPEDYVWRHIWDAPAYAALVAMGWGADLRTAYLTYKSLALYLGGKCRHTFNADPPEFDDIGFDFLCEEYKTSLNPGDIAAWDHEFAHQWDEPPEEVAA